MTELTSKLFLDVKKFEKYQTLLKKQVHLQSASVVDSPDFPNKHVYNKILRILGNHGEVTSSDLIQQFNFRASEVKDGIKALLSADFIT